MAFNFQPGSYTARPIDFSALADLPDAFWKGQSEGRENELRGWIKANPNAPIEEVAKHLMAADPVRGAQLIQSINNQNAINSYHSAQVANQAAAQEPDDIKLLKAWQEMNPPGAEPMRAGPAEPSGVPGMSLQNAPGFIQKKLGTVQDNARFEAEGKAQGERDSAKAGLAAAAPGVQKMIDQLIVNTKEADEDTFKHALGPLQGAGEADTWQGAIGNFLPQTWGALENYYDQGKKAAPPGSGILGRMGAFIGGEGRGLHIKEPGELPGGYTSTVRSKINSSQASLVNVLQRILRVPGIGQQSDKELQQLMAQVGELNRSRDKADFYDRLSNVVANFNNLGIPVQMPSADDLSGVQPTSAAVSNYTDITKQQPAAYDAAEPGPPSQYNTPEEATRAASQSRGSAAEGVGAPPPPPANALGRLRTALRAHPEAEEEIKAVFDRKFGRGQKGYADHYIYGEGR